jgi:hypothetical protein
VAIAAGGGVWRLSQGPVGAGALKPAAERWLAAQTPGGHASIGKLAVAWFGDSRSLGLRLDEVSLTDGKGRPVLRARRFDAGLALASLAGFAPAPGRLAAQDFFAALSVSPQGRYQLGYEASGAPGRSQGDLWRTFDDLTGKPRAGRPLSYLQDLSLSRGTVALREIGGPVAWNGQVDRVRLSKAGGRLMGHVEVRIADAALAADASGLVGLKEAQLSARVTGLVPARVFPWVGSTRVLSMLDAPVDGRGSLSWAAARGVRAADVTITAGAGHVRLSGAPTPFQSGELRAAYEPHFGQVVLQTAKVASAQAQLDLAGRAWLVPESASDGPARLQVRLSAEHARLSLSPKIAPAPIDGFLLQAGYAPATGRLELAQLKAVIDGAPLSLSGVLQRPRLPRSWGAELTGSIDGMLSPQAVTALWPDELGDDVRDWLAAHLHSGRLGAAQILVHLAPGAAAPHRALRRDALRIAFRYEDGALQVTDSAPVIARMRGSAVVQGDRFDMTVQSADMEGVALGEGSVQINRLMGDGKRLLVRARGQGDARAMLDAVDRTTGGAARAHGFDPQRLSGNGDVEFDVSRSLDDGPENYRAEYGGVIHQASVAEAALGMTLKAATIRVNGTLDQLGAEGEVQLGPYRGPLQYAADFTSGKPMVQQAGFDGALDASSFGLSGPAGSALRFSARFTNREDAGHGSVHSPAFSGAVDWSFAGPGRIELTGVADASSLRGVGAPVGKGVPDKVPVKLVLARSGAVWNGQLEADAYSGSIAFTAGSNRRLRYAAQLTPAEAQKLGFKASDRATSLALDVAMTGESGTAAYDMGPYLGQVSWSQTTGARTQYRWRTSLSAADLHSLGLPAGIDPKAPLAVDVILTSVSGGWNGSAEVGGGSFRFSASPPAKGVRRLNLGGGVDGSVLSGLGLTPDGMISGPAAISGGLDLGPEGLRAGHLEADFQRAAINAPYVPWKKPAGRPMRVDVDFARTADGWEASSIRGQGPGFGLAGQGRWAAASGGVLRIANAKLEGAFDGALDLAADNDGRKLTARARYFDARRLIQQGGQPAAGAGVGGAAQQGKPLTLDVQLGQVRVSETGLVRNVRIAGGWGGEQRRALDLAVARDDGSSLITLRLNPDAAGMAISGQVSDVGEAALAVFGQRQFKGGQASVNGRLVQGGADLHVEMSKVRLVQAPALARILTVGSLKGMADTLNGSGIEFAKVSAPVSIRGGRLNIGRARATGPAMGITTSGVIDIDTKTVDLSGGIAPSYVLNSAMGSAPVIGALLAPHKGEGMFGLTYSAKGAFASPKISVNPFSLAAPGILRRIFEARSASASLTPANGG